MKKEKIIKLILELKSLPLTINTKKTIQKLQQELNNILKDGEK